MPIYKIIRKLIIQKLQISFNNNFELKNDIIQPVTIPN
ncbi:hypothetical protein DDD_3084 [Nonlabens dokdonensis DSW-6]|uniref:Uncharacterized protein n=1 Tax=Nonlabens dokdonensis (strain DSM 17205 / KCTC 12402 / DSW-6) TaxID=592029 RepID=L7WE37_NONDD|nr:hypothetical protein DDD_3084 [Nonlabens dokdonensis DSW-6]